MVTKQEFIAGLLGPTEAALAPLALADAPGAAVRGLLSGQSASEALGGALSDPLSMEGRVHGEDITGGGISGALLEMLTDPAFLATGGLGGLGAVLSKRLGKRGLRHAVSPYGSISSIHRRPQWANLTEESVERGLEKLGRSDLPGGPVIDYDVVGGEAAPEVYNVLRAAGPDPELGFGQALERIVMELEHPGRHAVSPRGSIKPWEMKLERKQPREYSTRQLTKGPGLERMQAAERDLPSIAEQMGRELSPEDRLMQESRIEGAATVDVVRSVLAQAKEGDRESLDLLLFRFGNGFGSGPDHEAIIPYHGHGAETADDIKAVLSIRKEINSVLYDAGLIDEPMTIHEAVLQRRPTVATQRQWEVPVDPEAREEYPGGNPMRSIWAGSRSRDILEELSPLDLSVHTSGPSIAEHPSFPGPGPGPAAEEVIRNLLGHMRE